VIRDTVLFLLLGDPVQIGEGLIPVSFGGSSFPKLWLLLVLVAARCAGVGI
jgi:hypothetical protein